MFRPVLQIGQISQSCLQEEREKGEINRARIAEAAENKKELDKAKSELALANNEVQRLQRELQRNEDATIERQADRQKLSQHSKLTLEVKFQLSKLTWKVEIQLWKLTLSTFES